MARGAQARARRMARAPGSENVGRMARGLASQSAGQEAHGTQKESFPPNCMTRAPTEVPVMFPKVADSILALGLPNEGWFQTLKASARKVNRSRSRRANVLKRDMSVT